MGLQEQTRGWAPSRQCWAAPVCRGGVGWWGGECWVEQLRLLGASVPLRKDACRMHGWLSLFLQMSLYSFDPGLWDGLWIFAGWLSSATSFRVFLQLLSFSAYFSVSIALFFFPPENKQKIKSHLNLVPFGGGAGVLWVSWMCEELESFGRRDTLGNPLPLLPPGTHRVKVLLDLLTTKKWGRQGEVDTLTPPGCKNKVLLP